MALLWIDMTFLRTFCSKMWRQMVIIRLFLWICMALLWNLSNCQMPFARDVWLEITKIITRLFGWCRALYIYSQIEPYMSSKELYISTKRAVQSTTALWWLFCGHTRLFGIYLPDTHSVHFLWVILLFGRCTYIYIFKKKAKCMAHLWLWGGYG